ncbi:MAG TPA: GH92 family glycosyl hydrolase [Pseudonocardiaceae bacterium]|nr:GH92 family glycosyl hydrolase [Pseudonocardiaceae bacterium]
MAIQHRVRQRTAVIARGFAVAAVTLSAPGATAAPDAGPAGFHSSFESGDPAPDWQSTPDQDAGGRPLDVGVGSDANVLPGSVMGSVTSVTGTGSEPAGHGADKLTDGDPATNWQVPAAAGPVSITLSAATDVTSYTLTSAGDSPTRDPAGWTLQGSIDGSNWHTLDSRTGQTFSQRTQTRLFTVAAHTAYPRYRLAVNANHGDASTQLAELVLAAAPTAPTAMTTAVGNGPASGPTITPNQGFTGTHALRYGGWAQGAHGGSATDKLFGVSVPVQRDTQLTYDVFPELTGNDLGYPSTYVALDLVFTDGSRLSGLRPTDQYGMPATAAGQGGAKILSSRQWNQVTIDVGAVAAGRTIARIDLGWSYSAGPAHFGGWIDDITVDRAPAGSCADQHLSDCVVTTRGTNSSGDYSRGATIPAAALPHGFNFWTPVTDAGSTSNIYTYAQNNTASGEPAIQAFSVSHEPSPWVGEHQTFQVMPSMSTMPATADRATRELPFQHAHETARADYYGVTFDNGLRAEMTPTDHAAVLRFTFPQGTGSSLILDNITNSAGVTVDAQDDVITGFSDVSGFWGAPRMFVYATLDRPITATGTLTGGGGAAVSRYASLDLGSDRTVTMRIATSFISVDQAKHNLDLEVGSAGFDQIQRAAQATWDRQLGVITVAGATQDQLVSLYSSLYRLNLYPDELFENVGSATKPDYEYASPYSPATGANTPTRTGAAVDAGRPYANEGFWDTYRSAWSLDAILYPALTGQMIDGFVQQYKDGGWIGQWTAPGYLGFSGTSSDVAIADAYLRGVRDFDVPAAYDAAVKDAMVPSSGLTGRPDVQQTTFLGYAPASVGSSASASEEDYVNDYGIAQMSLELLHESAPTDPRRAEYSANYTYFSNRAQNYARLFDPSAGFFKPKNADGTFAETAAQYDPLNWNANDYTEGDGWTYAFLAPEDGAGLAALYGGRAGLAHKLDEFFATPETAQYGGGLFGPYHEMFESRDDRLGQWAFNDQPSMFVPYMYDYVGQPAKAAALTREALSRTFTGSAIGQGYPGDEDNGSMSAFYLTNALGLYPLQSGSPTLQIGSPLYPQATLHLPGDRTFTITAHGDSASNIYVQAANLDGRATTSTWLDSRALSQGGRLDLTMGPRPSAWGTHPNDAPPSLSTTTPGGPEADLTGAGRGSATVTGGESADALFDNTSATELALPASAASVQYTFDTPQTVEQYTLTAGSKDGGDPSAWVVRGSVDGTHWTVLDQQVGQTFAWRQQTEVYTPAHAGAYRYVRIDFPAPPTAAPVVLSEVELLGHHR